MRATFDTDGITFAKYPFAAASVYPHGRVAYGAIRDVDPDAAPPEVRLENGETLFISAEQASEFRDAISTTGLAVIHRVDVWDLLLEPFLDTECSAEHKKRTVAMLERVGVSKAEVSRIRRSLKSPMLVYNAQLWEWVHLGLYDVLTATGQGTPWAKLGYRLFPKRYDEFYWEAMELADRGRLTSTSKKRRRK